MNTSTTVSPVKTTGLAGIKNKVLSKCNYTYCNLLTRKDYDKKPKVVTKSNASQPSTMVNKAKYAPVKAKSELNSAKNKFVSNCNLFD